MSATPLTVPRSDPTSRAALSRLEPPRPRPVTVGRVVYDPAMRVRRGARDVLHATIAERVLAMLGKQ